MSRKQPVDNNSRVIAMALCMALGITVLKNTGLTNATVIMLPVLCAAIFTISVKIFFNARRFRTVAAKKNQKHTK